MGGPVNWFRVSLTGLISMKLVAGALLLMCAEQAYAHAQLVQFPNHQTATQVLVPASLVLLVLGVLVFCWGLLAEIRPNSKS